MGSRIVLLAAVVLALTATCKSEKTTGINNVPLSSCDSCVFLEKAGVCFNTQFEAAKIALANPQFGDALKNAETSCDKEEVCLLCDDPQTGQPTGACDLKPLACPDKVQTSTCERPFGYTPVERLAACGPNSHCLPYAYIDDAELIERVVPCANPNDACVPDFVIETAGKFTPRTCTGFAGGEGRCLPTSLPEIADLADNLPQAECAPDERCSSCYDATTGDDKGTCFLGCDKGPTRAAALFAACEGDAGRCVEQTSFAGDDAEYFERRDCAAGYLCVPTNVVGDNFVNCVGDNPRDDNYMGSCLNTDIMQIEQADQLSDQNFCQTRMGNGFRCVPCFQGGNATGAPGCPDAPGSYVPDRVIN